MRHVFAPGCALLIHSPETAHRLRAVLSQEFGELPLHTTCCRHAPHLPAGTRVINVCPGCDRRYRTLYDGITTVSLWELLAESATFPFPAYGGQRMTVHDACPTRDQARVHGAVRTLLDRMEIEVVEPERTRSRAVCCGDNFHGALPAAEVKARMEKRAGEMPAEDVVVTCISCIKAMHLGGRRPRHLVDLLFGAPTRVGTAEPEAWHAELDRFIDTH